MSAKSGYSTTGRRSGALFVLLTTVVSSMVYFGRANRSTINTSQGMITASPTPTPNSRLRVNNHYVTFSQFDFETTSIIQENPSTTRRVACEQAIDYLVATFLKEDDRARTTLTVNEATVTANIAASLTMRAQNPNQAEMEATSGTPDIEVESLIRGTALALIEHEDTMRAGFSTPSPEEIAESVANMASGTINISALPFSSAEDGEELMDELSEEWGAGDDAIGFANDFVARVVSARSLSEYSQATETYVIQPDVSSYPDYVQDAISSQHGPGALVLFKRQDGTGVIYFLNDVSTTPKEDLGEIAIRDLTVRNEQRAEATYVASLRANAIVEIYVDCATY